MKIKAIASIIVASIAAILVSSVRASVVKKPIGDINGCGKTEYVIEDTSPQGFTNATVVCGKKIIFRLPGLSGNTADGYEIVGKQIVVWIGDWETVQPKWEPHFYDFAWYRWDNGKKRFCQIREGFTKKAYTYNQAKKLFPTLAANPIGKLIISQRPTFELDAASIITGRYRGKLNASQRIDNNQPLRGHWSIVELQPKGRPVQDYSIDFMRDGTYKIRVMDMNCD